VRSTAAPALTFDAAWASFCRALKAEGARPWTLTTYTSAANVLGVFLRQRGLATEPAAITRQSLEEFLSDQLANHQPATAANRYRAMRRFFGWLEAEGEIDASPMTWMRSPRVPVKPPEVVDDATITLLLRSCNGGTFEDRRDAAILSLLVDTGMRRSECAGIRLEDVDLDRQTVSVTGRGSRTRSVPFGAQAARSLDRYLRVRPGHPRAASEMLWLGHVGAIQPNGVYQIVERRARLAGIEQRLRPHLFRHTMAHKWLSAGGEEGDLMRIAGWSSRSMLDRYGAAEPEDRARAAHRRLSPLDRMAR